MLAGTFDLNSESLDILNSECKTVYRPSFLKQRRTRSNPRREELALDYSPKRRRQIIGFV